MLAQIEPHSSREQGSILRAIETHFRLNTVHVQLLSSHDTASFRLVCGPPFQTLALRIYDPRHHRLEHIAAAQNWVAHLAEYADFKVADAVPADGGSLVFPVSVDGATRPAVLSRWLVGRQGAPFASTSQIEAIGELAARVHMYSHAVAAAGWNLPPRWDASKQFGPGSMLTSGHLSGWERREFEQVGDVVGRAFETLAATSNACGIIHGDFHHGNILIRGNTRAVIDFEDVAIGPYLYDLAVAAVALEVNERVPHARQALLTGYQRHRSLSFAERALFDYLVLAHLIDTANWHLRHPDPAHHAWVRSSIATILAEWKKVAASAMALV